MMDSPNIKQHLLGKISDKTAQIGVIGLGYVGLPLALRFSEVGFQVTGFDIDPEKVSSILGGSSYISHIDDSSIVNATEHGFRPTGDFSSIADMDAIVLCVPTPLSAHREPDISFITSTMQTILPFLRAGQIVSLESTTYPGTTEEELLPRIESRGLQVGKDIFLVYSPEREDPGNPNFSTRSIPKICGGHTPACLSLGEALYASAIDRVVTVSSTKCAEMTKLLENIHRAVNIGLVNELKVVADRMDIDIHEVIKAAATKPFGFTPYYPGPGLGGHCIPIDPFYLTWKAREFGVHTRFIELAGEVNAAMPDFVMTKLVGALNTRFKPVRGSSVLVLGIAYKRNVDDMRESPSVVLMEMLASQGARVEYSDPYVPTFPKMRQHHFDLKSISLSPDVIAGFDCVLLATDHDDFDYEMIKRSATLIVDTRGRFQNGESHIVKA